MTDTPPMLGVLYPRHYAWYLVAATLDVLVTHFILSLLGGREVNALADRLIDHYGTWGLIVLKYSTVIVVVFICETVGRRKPSLGRFLATAAVVISALPVGLGLLQVAIWTHLA